VSLDFRLGGVTVRYGATVALDRVDLEIGDGEAVALVGPSGAGKTTLLRLLNASIRASEGSVASDGRTLASLAPRELRKLRARVAFVPQDLALVPQLRVVQNVVTGRVGRTHLAGTVRDLLFPTRTTVRAVYETLHDVGIPEKLYERTDSLSGGQQQRVAIARALFQRPDALLADEPVTSVDPARARATVELLLSLQSAESRTLVVSLHDRELALEFFPRLVGIRHGRVVFDRRREDVTTTDLRDLYDLASAVEP
jgi:phosphonate transport system ATP-binding protein